MSRDEVEVSAGDKGLSIKAKGGAASRLGHTLADLISPFSNFTGLIGDEIRNIRVYREAALKKALERSHEIAIENGISVKPVPTKFLVNWSEGASMEDVQADKNLTELWANLLVKKASSELPNSLIYVDLLKKMESHHIHNLTSFVEDIDFEKRPFTFPILKSGLGLSFWSPFDEFLEDELISLASEEQAYIKLVSSRCRHKQGAMIVLSYLAEQLDDDYKYIVHTEKFKDNDLLSSTTKGVLRGLGLLSMDQIFKKDVKPSDSERTFTFLLRYVELSPLGASLIEACTTPTMGKQE